MCLRNRIIGFVVCRGIGARGKTRDCDLGREYMLGQWIRRHVQEVRRVSPLELTSSVFRSVLASVLTSDRVKRYFPAFERGIASTSRTSIRMMCPGLRALIWRIESSIFF